MRGMKIFSSQSIDILVCQVKIGKLEYEALRASNEQDVHKWLEAYLPQNKVEDDTENEQD
jgi:hypothetical protein